MGLGRITAGALPGAGVLLLVASAVALGSSDPPAPIPGGAPGPPNVVLYVVDTLRADHLGVYGYRLPTSPVLDRWAAGGVVFERAYAPTSWTRPSMVSLFTGLDAISHGVEDRLDVIPGDVRLLSERLKAKGYATFAAVTNPNVLPAWGFGRGYDGYEDLDSVGQGTRADVVSDFFARRMDALVGRQPFFVYLHVIDPHAPYDPPPPFDERFPRSPAFPPHQSIGSYDGEVAFVDTQFARILESLRSHGVEDDTMVVFVADHGEELFDHGGFGHGAHLFEEVVRVPLVIRFPKGAHAGARVGALASLTDVTPTILRVVGEPTPPDLDGRDLTELLNDPARRWPDRQLFLSLATTGSESNLVRGVVGKRHKYLRRTRPTPAEALVDLDRDPTEIASATRLAPRTRTRLSAALDAHLARKSKGIHLRIVHELQGDPVGCEATLTTTGRFGEVAGIRLEAGDRFEVSSDRQTLRFDCRLENRAQVLLAGTRRVPDEDGLRIEVRPPGARITLKLLARADGRQLPLAAGTRREPQTVPFAFDPTAATLAIRDADELSGAGDAARAPSTARAFLGVIRSPPEPVNVPEPVTDRLRSLGYLPGPGGE